MLSGAKALCLLLCIGFANLAVGQEWNQLLERADSLSRGGNQYVAIDLAKSALQLARRDSVKSSSSLDRIQSKLGLYSYLNGDYENAETYWESALATAEAIHGKISREAAECRDGLGDVTYMVGRLSEAEVLYQNSLEIREKVLMVEDAGLARSLRKLGNVYYMQGRLDKAEHNYRLAGEIARRITSGESLDYAAAINGLALVHCVREEYDAAEQLFKTVLRIQEKILGRNHVDLSAALGGLASVYFRQGRYDPAESLFQRSHDVVEMRYGKKHLALAMTLDQIASVRLARGDVQGAKALLLESLDIREQIAGKRHMIMAQGLEDIAKLYRESGQRDSALYFYQWALDIRAEDLKTNSLVLSESQALDYSDRYRFCIDNFFSCIFDAPTLDQPIARSACNAALDAKGTVSELLYERARPIAQSDDPEVDELVQRVLTAKTQLANYHARLQRVNDRGIYQRTIDSLTENVNDAEADLSLRSLDFRKQYSSRSVTADDIGTLLPEHTTFIEFLKWHYHDSRSGRNESRYLALICQKSEIPQIVNLCSAVEVDTLIELMQKHMVKVAEQMHLPTLQEGREYSAIAKRLYELLVRPLEDRIGVRQDLFVAPDGELSLLSFGCLVDDSGRYLIEKYPIHYLSAGRDLIRLKNEDEHGRGFFALADPDFDAPPNVRSGEILRRLYATTAGGPDADRNVRPGCRLLSETKVNRLPESATEVEAAAKTWDRRSNEPVKVYRGPFATEDRFKANAPGNRIIHLATHGYYIDPECNSDYDSGSRPEIRNNPLLMSGLLLAGANLHGEGADSAGLEDGILTAMEVSAIDLNGTELVVLSSCESGLGEVQAGEGVYGLRRAFLAAGARTVVSTLWRVSDEWTAQIMSGFYEDPDLPVAQRIRQLQLSQIKRLRDEGLPDHPFLWGAFIATGDWR